MQLSCLMWCASSGFWFWFPPVEWGLSWPSSSWSWRSLTRICMGTGKWARNCGVQKSSDGWLIRRALKNHREEVVQSRNIYSRTAVHNGNVFPKRRLSSLKNPALMRIVPSLPDGNHLISGIKLTNRAFPIMRPNLAKVYLSYTLSPIFQSDSSPPKKNTHQKHWGISQRRRPAHQELFITGDTSQTVSRAVDFRFCDLRSLFHHFEVAVPELDQLIINYRSHQKTPGWGTNDGDGLWFPWEMDQSFF